MSTGRRELRTVMLVATIAAVLSTHMLPAVVITEIHYNPDAGKDLEFVELFNPLTVDIDLGGWRFGSGLRYEFPVGSLIPAQGYVVVARNRAAVAEAFGLNVAQVLGDHSSSLDNGGEPLELLDAAGRVADELRYDDDPPWPAAADGEGSSLQRLCTTFEARTPANWTAAAPTPLASTANVQCPPDRLPAPAIAINEIHYHPPNAKDVDEEYVELINNTSAAVNLKGYSFADGFEFEFTADTLLEPGSTIVVCRNQAAVRELFGITNTVGDFVGQLSNSGERLTLVDAEENFVDSVRYLDHSGWPAAADSLGYSLERIAPRGISDDPANWQVHRTAALEGWHTVTVTGRANSSDLLFNAQGDAEFLIDNVELVDVANPGVNLIANGDFSAGLDGWNAEGSHAFSGVDEDGGADGSAALRVSATARGSSASDGVSTTTVEALDTREAMYQLTFDYRHVVGMPDLVVRIFKASTSNGGVFWQLGDGQQLLSPGAENSFIQADPPPMVDQLHRIPQEPTSQDVTWINARVRGGDIDAVTLRYRVNETETIDVVMLDDGASNDGAPNDGVYGASVPPQPHGSRVIFRIVAEGTSGTRVEPLATDPSRVRGYYVNDLRPDTPFPLYNVILDPNRDAAPQRYLGRLSCVRFNPGAFAFQGDLFPNVDIRARGQSICSRGVAKRPFKIRFRRGRFFQGQRKLNFQSMVTDKVLMREHLAWGMFREMNYPASTHDYIRLHVNGEYFGLYSAMEHPDQRFLARAGLDPDGNLYKSNGGFEEETNEDGDLSDIEEFVERLDTTPPEEMGEFIRTFIEEDAALEFQATHSLICNTDYTFKNHFFFHDLKKDKWRLLPWDLDLSFGKTFNQAFDGPLNDNLWTPGPDPFAGTGMRLLGQVFSFGDGWYRRAYAARLWIAVEEKLNAEVVNDKLGFLRDLLWEEQQLDFDFWGRSLFHLEPDFPIEFGPHVELLRDHMAQRREFIIRRLEEDGFTRPDRLKITELMYNPVGPEEDGEFLELWNNTGSSVDISGWTIKGLGRTEDDGSRSEYFFPEGTTVDVDEVIVLAKDPEVFRQNHTTSARVFGPYPGNLANDGETLRVRDAGPGFPATVDFLLYDGAAPWPQLASGRGHSLELTDVHRQRDNDLAPAWRDSEQPGGTPGVLPLRPPQDVNSRAGDCNGDGAVNLSDAIMTLENLFRGTRAITCHDSCDANADGLVDLADAVGLLNRLYIGDEGSAGIDVGDCREVDGAFCEQSNCEL